MDNKYIIDKKDLCESCVLPSQSLNKNNCINCRGNIDTIKELLNKIYEQIQTSQ